MLTAPRVIAAAPAPERNVPQSNAPKSHDILLVEDDELVGTTITTLLRRLGNTVTWVQCSEDALTKLQEEAQAYAAIFTDLNMPGLGGEALVSRLKTTEFKGKVIVLSGNIPDETSQRLRAAGVTDLVQKPFDLERIKTLLAER